MPTDDNKVGLMLCAVCGRPALQRRSTKRPTFLCREHLPPEARGVYDELRLALPSLAEAADSRQGIVGFDEERVKRGRG